jgi:hypothetical protein
MGFFSNLFGSKAAQPAAPEGQDSLVPVPIPPLGTLLLQLEAQKGSLLTEEEVLSARNKAVCMMMRLSHKQALEDKRGYRDVDPGNVWLDWQAFRVEERPNET